jgi:hypothetical protein
MKRTTLDLPYAVGLSKIRAIQLVGLQFFDFFLYLLRRVVEMMLTMS